MVSIEYLAGFIDGEGSIQVSKGATHKTKKRIYYLRLSVHQMDRRPLAEMSERWGGSLRYVTSHHPRPIWEWVVSGTTAGRVIAEIEPFLITKREQAVLGLRFQSLKTGKGSGRPTTDEQLAQHDAIYQEMRALKH